MCSRSPMPSSCSAPCSPRMVRLSNLLITWKLMRVGKLALMVPVITSTEGRCVAMITWMPAARAICARRCTACLDLLAGDHHQVRHLVDHDDDERQQLQRQRLVLEDRAAGLGVEAGLHLPGRDLALGQRLRDPLVVAADVAHAELAHRPVAPLHLAHGPFQRGRPLSPARSPPGPADAGCPRRPRVRASSGRS